LYYSDNTSTAFAVITQATGWEFFDVTGNLLFGKALNGFGVYGYESGGFTSERTYLDDVVLSTSPVPIPAAIWLFGTALIGLLGFGKRRKVA